MCRTHNRDTWGRRSAECDAMQTTSPSVFRLDWARLACDFGRQRIHGYTAWSDSRQTAAQHGEWQRPCCFLASLGACFGCRWRAWERSHESGGRGWLVLKLPQAPQRIFPENPLHQVVGFGTCRRSRETRWGARRALSMWTCTGVSHKPHTVTENEWMLLQRRKHNLSIGSPQCKKRASVFLHKSTGGASELGPLGKLAGFWS